MKSNGIYYLPSVDKIVIITNCHYYSDVFNVPFSIVTWEQEDRICKQCLIEQYQFNEFVKIGVL